MKKYFAFFLILAALCFTAPALADVAINEDHFPDQAFREYLQSEADPNQDGILTQQEIAGIKSLQCFMLGIKDLRGIQYFEALTELECFGNELTSLDVSKNTELTYLNCYHNHLSSLDVSALPKLSRLICSANEFTTLNLSDNPALTMLRCYEGNLTKLDISKNPSLEEVKIYNNNISSLDVSSNPELRILEVYGNDLTTLDLDKCPYLSKAVRNGIQNSSVNGGGACSYTDEGTDSELIVDKGVTIKYGSETAVVPGQKDPEPGNSSSEDSGMGGIASPAENTDYYVGTPVLLDFYPTGSIVLGNISYSGTCQVLLGDSLKLDKTFSGIGSINSSVKHIQYYFTPDIAGIYTIKINCSYRLSGVSISSSRHTRSFRVTDPSANVDVNDPTVPADNTDPTKPGTTDPGNTDPTKPGTTDPGKTNPTAPGKTDPGVASPTDPSSTEPTTAPPVQSQKSSQKIKGKTTITKTFKVSILKKKAQSISLGQKAKTSLSYKVAKKDPKKVLSLKKGKVIVKKKAKKGTYTIKIKVTAKATKKYKKATKTVTVKVKIK